MGIECTYLDASLRKKRGPKPREALAGAAAASSEQDSEPARGNSGSITSSRAGKKSEEISEPKAQTPPGAPYSPYQYPEPQQPPRAPMGQYERLNSNPFQRPQYLGGLGNQAFGGAGPNVNSGQNMGAYQTPALYQQQPAPAQQQAYFPGSQGMPYNFQGSAANNGNQYGGMQSFHQSPPSYQNYSSVGQYGSPGPQQGHLPSSGLPFGAQMGYGGGDGTSYSGASLFMSGQQHQQQQQMGLNYQQTMPNQMSSTSSHHASSSTSLPSASNVGHTAPSGHEPQGKEIPLEFFTPSASAAASALPPAPAPAAAAGASAPTGNNIVDSLYMTLFGSAQALFPDDMSIWDTPSVSLADISAALAAGMGGKPADMDQQHLLSTGSLASTLTMQPVTIEEMLHIYWDHVEPNIIPIFASLREDPVQPELPEGLKLAILALTSLYIPKELLPHPRDAYYRAACSCLFPPVPSLATVQALAHLTLYATANKSVRVGDGFLGMAHTYARGIRLHKPFWLVSERYVTAPNDRARIERSRVWQFLFFLDRVAGILMHRQFLIGDEEVRNSTDPSGAPEDIWLDGWVRQGKVFGHTYHLADPTLGSAPPTVPNLRQQYLVVKDEIASFQVDSQLLGETNARWLRLAARRNEIMLMRIRHLWKSFPKLAPIVEAVFGPENASALDQLALASSLKGTMESSSSQSVVYSIGDRRIEVGPLIPPFSIYAAFYNCIVCLADPIVVSQENMVDAPIPDLKLEPGINLAAIGRGALRYLGLLETGICKDWSCAEALSAEVRRRIGNVTPTNVWKVNSEPDNAQPKRAPIGQGDSAYEHMEGLWTSVWRRANEEERET